MTNPNNERDYYKEQFDLWKDKPLKIDCICKEYTSEKTYNQILELKKKNLPLVCPECKYSFLINEFDIKKDEYLMWAKQFKRNDLLIELEKKKAITTDFKIFQEKIENEYSAEETENFNNLENDLINNISNDCIIKIDNKIFEEDLIELIQNISENNGSLVFTIPKNEIFNGRIINKISDTKKEVHLINKYKYIHFDKNTKQNIEYYKAFLFSDTKKRGRGELIKSLTGNFYFYKFYDGEKDHVLLSIDKLEIGDYVVDGMLLQIDDLATLGEAAKLKMNLPIIFCHTAKNKIIDYKNHEELFKQLKKYNLTKDKFFSYIFSCGYNDDLKGKSARHPHYFEELMSAFLLHTKYDNYPMHLVEFSRQGTGKTTQEEAIHSKIGESIPIVEGSNSTMKALVPSFKNPNNPEVGALIRTSMFCIVDEFLRILQRVRSEDRQTELGTLNPLLEHKERLFGSGQGQITAKMTSRLFAVSNEVYGTHSMADLCDKLDTAFLSRLIIWFIDENHIKYVQSGKGLQETELNIEQNDFISILKYMHSFKSEFNNDKINEIFEKYKPFIADKPLQVYEARYTHHMRCLIDGIVKTRCLTSFNESFSAIDEDYDILNEIWRNMVVNWKGSVILENLPYDDIKKYLTKEEVFIYESIKEQDKIYYNKIETFFSEIKTPSYYINHLLDIGLIKLDNHYYKINFFRLNEMMKDER